MSHLSEAATLLSAPGTSKGKSAKKGKAEREPKKLTPGGDKLQVPGAKGNKTKKSARTPPPTPSPRLEQTEIQDPVWLAENKIALTMHQNKPWVIEKKRPKNWFQPNKMKDDTKTLSALPTCESVALPSKWTETGERVARRYQLRIVIKDPRTMALFFMQRKKRHVLAALRIFILFAEQSTSMKQQISTIPGLVRKLVQMIQWRSGLCQRLALILLASLSEVKLLAKHFIRSGGYPRIRLLFDLKPDAGLMAWLALLVRNLSKNSTLQIQLLAFGFIDTVLDLIAAKGQDPDVVQYYIQALIFMCGNRKIRKFLVVKDGFVAIMDLIFSAYRYIQYLALMLIQKLLKTSTGKPIYR